MGLTVAQAIAGLAMLYFGGDALVRGAATLAARLGVTPLVVGLTVVAFGTSAPELVVSLHAALTGANDISVGNVVGSNIANIALILGFSSLVRPSRVAARILRVDAPIMIIASVLCAVLIADEGISRLEGALLLVGLVAYVVFTFRSARRESSPVREEIASAAPVRSVGVGLEVLLVLGGLGLLVGGGAVLVDAAVELATAFGVSHAAIGLTIVAVGTSLPEFSTSLVASFKGHGEIAVGNVIGSNIFNLLGILGLTALVRPLALGAISWLDLGLMVGLAGGVTFFISTGLRLGRIEGAVLLSTYVAYTIWMLGA